MPATPVDFSDNLAASGDAQAVVNGSSAAVTLSLGPTGDEIWDCDAIVMTFFAQSFQFDKFGTGDPLTNGITFKWVNSQGTVRDLVGNGGLLKRNDQLTFMGVNSTYDPTKAVTDLFMEVLIPFKNRMKAAGGDQLEFIVSDDITVNLDSGSVRLLYKDSQVVN